ncbi:hypothetical protein, partial [Cytobacillus gottheilii]|uniref:hypothetical protein n=1 Tax=Cytobacillus gottheilii TaxID=859144 RepID=UPI0036155F9B
IHKSNIKQSRCAIVDIFAMLVEKFRLKAIFGSKFNDFVQIVGNPPLILHEIRRFLGISGISPFIF